LARQSSDPGEDVTRCGDSTPAVFAVLWLIMLVLLVRRPAFTEPVGPVPQTVASVDPNVAPWWELTILPRVGEITARKIVRYRECAAGTSVGKPAGKPFRRPADLEAVNGIGPITVQRMAPYLCF
jgi:hypothetical protein